MKRLRRPELILFVTLVLPGLALTGCGGSSNRTSDPTDPPTCMSFTPAQAPGAGVVAPQVDPSSTCEILVLNMMVTDVDDLWAGGADLRFPINLMNYTGISSTGSVLDDGGAAVLVEGTRPCPDSSAVPADWCQPFGQFYGQVVVGITRSSGTASGVDVVGSQRLFRLTFTKGTGEGTATLSFPSNASLSDGQRPPQVILPAPTWVGGTVSVN